MDRKPCSLCGLPSQFSLACLLSTIGQKPRKQKCTRSVLFCVACIRGFCEALATMAPNQLLGSLVKAYTALAPKPLQGSDPLKAQSEPFAPENRVTEAPEQAPESIGSGGASSTAGV